MILDLRNPFPNLLALIFAGILLFVLSSKIRMPRGITDMTVTVRF